jgi:hypothetical protein
MFASGRRLLPNQRDVILVLPAGGRACLARNRTGLAVIHGMGTALFRAFLTKSRASLQKCISALAASGHHGQQESAGIGAIEVTQDTAGKRHGFIFLDARTRTVFAGRHALLQPPDQFLVG